MKWSLPPWSVSAGMIGGGNPRVIIEDALGNTVCATSLRGVQGDIEQLNKNAKLIAAAPELYAALETVSKNCRLEAIFPGPIIRKIMDALQKARGEQ